MKYRVLFIALLLSPTVIMPIIWLHKDPQAIINGTHDFFFPYQKPENIAIVRNYEVWAQEVLSYFAQKIEQYPASPYCKDKDPALVAQAQALLQEELNQLRTTLLSSEKKELPRPSCNTNFSSKQRKKLARLLRNTPAQLFGVPSKKVNMVGIQGPKLIDFERRAAIEDTYSALRTELDRYSQCLNLSEQDILNIKKAHQHVYEAYEQVLDEEGLKTAQLMKNV